jgi:hypothetical protein
MAEYGLKEHPQKNHTAHSWAHESKSTNDNIC